MADQNRNNQTVTWNNGATAFDGYKLNVTDTASAAASLLQNFQVGGVAKWTVRKDGKFTSAGDGSIAGNLTITGTLGVTGAFTAAAIAGTTGTFSGAISGTNGTFSGVVGLAGGTLAAPGIGWTGDANTGFYRSADGEIAVALNGVAKGAWTANGFNTGLGTALVNPNGSTVGVSLSTIGAISSYATSGINVQLGYNGNFTSINFIRAAVSVGTISHTAGATAYNTSSDKDLKTDWRMFDAGAILDRLEVWDFAWKESGTRAYGVLAQDAYEVFPNAITPARTITDNETGEESHIPWEADYSKFVPLLIAEIKDLRRRLAKAGL